MSSSLKSDSAVRRPRATRIAATQMEAAARHEGFAQPAPRGPRTKLILFSLGLIIVVGIALDLGQRGRGGRVDDPARPPADNDPAARILGLHDRHYADPDARFELTVPEAWVVIDGPKADPYTAKFLGPGGMDILVRLRAMTHDRLDELEREIRGIEFDRGLDTHIRPRFFNGRPVIERGVRLFEKEMVLLDFMCGTTAHHIQAAAPRGTFERDQRLLWEILATYRTPTNPPAGPTR